MRNQVQLIAYADRFGGDISGLHRLVRDRFAGVFGGVHVLPFFTPFDGADAGFDPIAHTVVDPRLGSWDDIRELGAGVDTVVDVIVNHVSVHSAQFRDVLARGEDSPNAGMFLTMSSVFPDGATEEQLAALYRPRPGLPFTPMTLGGQQRLVWTTFTSQQVDLDLRSPLTQEYLLSILDTLADAGVALIRLDAAGYAVKTPGTSSFMTPETFAFLDEFSGLARKRGLSVLVELHSYYKRQVEIGRAVDRVYDFALPPLVLHAAYTGDHSPLLEWMRIRPTNAVTVLDTHDGIGIVDVGPDQTAPDRPGLLTSDQLDALVEGIHKATGGDSCKATGWAASNLDVYQVNSTYYDALGRDDRRYLAARALQFFTPGIPQVYYVGALAGHNDLELLARSGVGRDINRHNFTDVEIDDALTTPVVRALCDLARFRNTFAVFDGDFSVGEQTPGGSLTLTWVDGTRRAELSANLGTGDVRLEWEVNGVTRCTTDLLQTPPAVS
jgi:sucrose phosphorylase